jgi:hypothetical protein
MLAMTFTLQVVLEGICLLVPDSPFFNRDPVTTLPVRGNPSQVTVLLPDLYQPGLASWSTADQPVIRAPHWPVLIFNLAHYDPSSTRSIDMVTKSLSSGAEQGIILLDGEHLTLSSPPARPPFKPDLTIPNRIDFPDLSAGSRELNSLWWVPQMLQLSPNLATAPPSGSGLTIRWWEPSRSIRGLSRCATSTGIEGPVPWATRSGIGTSVTSQEE